MKHRSVIAFVIVAAALFAAPQLSHDLQSLRSGLGARLRGELLQAFLSLHPADGASAAPSARGARTLLASCTKGKIEAPAAKAKKNEARAAAEPQSGETTFREPAVNLAMITEPASAPDVWKAQAARAQLNAGGEALATREEAGREVAMIIPPDFGIEPPALAELSAAVAKAHEGAALKRKEAEEIRRVTFVATGFEGRQLNLNGPAGEALRRLSETLPGNFEFRLEGNGSKSKTLKVIKRVVEAGRPTAAPAPRAQRLPGAVACTVTATAADAQTLSVADAQTLSASE
jgi:hypothetical protein